MAVDSSEDVKFTWNVLDQSLSSDNARGVTTRRARSLPQSRWEAGGVRPPSYFFGSRKYEGIILNWPLSCERLILGCPASFFLLHPCFPFVPRRFEAMLSVDKRRASSSSGVFVSPLDGRTRAHLRRSPASVSWCLLLRHNIEPEARDFCDCPFIACLPLPF